MNCLLSCRCSGTSRWVSALTYFTAVWCLLTDSGAEEWNPLSKGEKCRGGHKWQFLSCVKCWCVSICCCLLGTERWNNKLFFFTYRRCWSCVNCVVDNFRWVTILTTPTKTWQGTLMMLQWYSATPPFGLCWVYCSSSLCCSSGDALFQDL